MRVVQINGVTLTEDQINAAYKKLQGHALPERCIAGYRVYSDESVSTRAVDEECHKKSFTLYPSLKTAKKASKLIHESKKLIMACLLVDPDFEPDWSDCEQEKWAVTHDYYQRKYVPTVTCRMLAYAAYVSTEEKAKIVCKLMKVWKDE